MGLGVLAAGVRPGTPDMGGMQTTEQVGLRARGLGGFDGEQQVEGMSIQSYEGRSQSFLDDTLQSEMTVTTAAIPADTGGGGIRLNMILKDGGNQFSGSAFMGGTQGHLGANNIDDELRSRNLTVRQRHRSSRGVHRIARRPNPEGQAVVDPLGPPSVDRDDDPNVPKYVTAADGETVKVDQRSVRPQPVDAADVAGDQEDTRSPASSSAGGTRRATRSAPAPTCAPASSATRRNAHHAIGNMKVTAPVTNNWLFEAGYSFAEFYWKGGRPSGRLPSSPRTLSLRRRGMRRRKPTIRR